MFIYIYICIYSIVGFGNIVKFLIIVLKFVYNKICYMVKKNNLDFSDLIFIIFIDYLILMYLFSLREELCFSKGILNG